TIFLIYMLISVPAGSYSQNLVPNGSFENYVDFDGKNPSGWHKVQNTDTPDYFNIGVSRPVNNIFGEYLGGASAKYGDSFVGFFCYRIQPARRIKDVREYIETPLDRTLEKDSLYRVSVSLVLDAESNVAIKNFGIYFSQSTTIRNWGFKTFRIKPQVEFNGTFLDSMQNWIELHSLYLASGFEKYLVLGNFRNDRATSTEILARKEPGEKKEKWQLAKHELSAYYYVDNIILEKVTVLSPKPDSVVVGTENDESALPYYDVDKIDIDSTIILKNIQFGFNKSDLLPQSFPEMDKLYKLMNENMNIRVKLEGHTDDTGGYEFNLRLSLDRAEAVARYLVSKGIDAGRIEYDGYSFSRPIESNETDKGQAANRRVVFKIIQK
ncbi:MAG TPA: OmpA family protein, partial [Bacteroidales bacterium]|nr:OmpA family protein [Bacteroidales bacterium]